MKSNPKFKDHGQRTMFLSLAFIQFLKPGLGKWSKFGSYKTHSVCISKKNQKDSTFEIFYKQN